MRNWWVSGLVVVGLLVASCGAPGGSAGGLSGDAAAIDVEAVAQLSDDAAAEVARSVNAFGFDLHRRLIDPGANVVTSPMSVSVLLAMVAAGADGQTAAQMREVLHLEQTRDSRFAALLRRVSDTDDVELSVGNALWADDEVTLEDDYVTFVQDTFGATLDEVPLEEQASADTIDEWVADRTHGRIEEVAADLGLPDPRSVLVLANAVYFLGSWTQPFDPEQTAPAPFTLADGSTVEVPTMHRRVGEDADAQVADLDGHRVLRLPYGDEQRYAMEIFLPTDDGGLPALLDRLDVDSWQQSIDALEPADGVEIALPTFELSWKAELNEVLKAMGMPAAFSPDADFRPMSPTNPFLDTVVHKTYIRVDEEGTEAAAVAAADMAESAGPTFTVDRPFVFTITDHTTGTVLFLGTVNDPRG